MFTSHFDLCDVVSILLYCEDETFLIVQETSTQEFWLPSAKVPEGKTWRSTVKALLETVRINSPVKELCHVIKVWKPPTDQYINHAVFVVRVESDSKEYLGNIPGKRAYWATANEVQMSYPRLRSSELLDFISYVLDMPFQRPKVVKPLKKTFPKQPSWTSLICTEGLTGLSEIREEHVLMPYNTMHDGVMNMAGFNANTQHSIFTLFLMSCFPCMLMNVRIFTGIVERLGWDRALAIRLFATADVDAVGFLSYRDFLYIVAVTDPNAMHGADSEIRSTYIFKYYDLNNDSVLDLNETKVLFSDMRQAKNKSQDSMALCRDFEGFAKLLGVEPKRALSQEAFVSTLSSPILRGTSVLLRLGRDISYLAPDLSASKSKPPPPRLLLTERTVAPAAALAKRPEYGVAAHCVKIKKQVTAIDLIWNMTQVMSDTSLKLGRANLMNSPSLDCFNPTKTHFEVLRGLEYFEKEITPKEVAAPPASGKARRRTPKAAFHWGQVDTTGFGRCLMTISNLVMAVMLHEPRMVALTSPVHVLGDLHGNLADLLRFEKALWPMGPTLSPATLLTLGDYVDRGPHSIELIAYLFAYKVQSPHKLALLRGNHEMRHVQKLFSFYDECISKFGERLGTEVWEAVNNAMDCMPLAAIIDGKVFCVHGGIPPPWLCTTVKAIYNVQAPLSHPEEQSPLAWELMWNDPVDPTAAFVPSVLKEMKDHEGFAPNPSRQTGHVFNADALARFLKVNNLNIVLRAHEMKEKGFHVQMKCTLQTVFSTTNYNNARNDAACILANNGKLRAFVISTLTPSAPKQ